MADDSHLVERTARQRSRCCRGDFLRVQRDTVALPDGSRRRANTSATPARWWCVPLLDDGRLLLERQYRYPLQQVLLEFPAGKIDAGESPLACGAARTARGDRLPRA